MHGSESFSFLHLQVVLNTELITNTHPQVDAINMISKVPGLPDAPIVNPEEEFQPAGLLYVNGFALVLFLIRFSVD